MKELLRKVRDWKRTKLLDPPPNPALANTGVSGLNPITDIEMAPAVAIYTGTHKGLWFETDDHSKRFKDREMGDKNRDEFMGLPIAAAHDETHWAKLQLMAQTSIGSAVSLYLARRLYDK